MARDYAKKERSQPARRKGGRKAGPVSGWLWGAMGLVVGLFIAFLVFLDQSGTAARPEPGRKDEREKAGAPARVPDQAGARPEKIEPSKKPLPAAAPDTAKAEPEKKPLSYDFYKVLPEFEVKVPAERSVTPARPPKPAAGVHYLLQVGSFRSAQDADARKAELALLGIVSSVQTVTDTSKGTWHRVRLGPYRQLEQVNRVRERLKENGIDSMTIKENS